MVKKTNKLAQHPVYKKHKQKVKFLLVGAVNSLTDFSIYGMLANVLSMNVVVANMISTSISMVISFLLNYKFVWESKRTMRETAPKFVAVSLFSAWVVQSVIIWVVVGIFGDSEIVALIAKLSGMAAGMVFNYLGYRYIFR